MNRSKIYIFYRKIVFTFLCIVIFGINSSMLLASPGYDISVNQDKKATMALDLKLSDFQIKETEIDGVKYSTIDFGGNITTQKKGWAKLPVINASVKISSQQNYDLQIEDEEFEEYSLEYPLLPSRGVFYRDQDPSAIPYIIADDAVASDQWYPGERAAIFEPFILRDVRGLGIRFNPFQYNAAKNTLRIYTKITINLLENDENPTNELLAPQSSIIPVMDKIYESVFLNYTSQISDDTYLEIGEMGDILVIYTSRDKSAIQPYILWKREKGFQVHEDEVSTGTDVTNIIKDAYQANNDILYVQLVGDWNDIKGPSTSKNEPLDPKLGQVAGSDSYADIIIGRFSAGSASNVSAQVAKTISYEKNPDLDGDWYNKALGIGGTDGPSDDESTDWGQVDAIKTNRLLSSTYTEVNEAYKNPSTSQVTDPINEGLSLINYCNHGAVSNLPVGNISNSVADNMNNGKKLFFITAVACNPGEFSRDSLAEHLMNNANGGAINVWFASISQPWYPPYYGQDYFNDLLIGGYNYDSNPGSGINTTEGRTTFGSLAFNAGILMYTEDTSSESKNTMESWIVFGDASLQVRTDKPKPISLSNTDIEPNGTFMTNLTSQSSPVEGALVSLYQNGNTFSALTNSSGEVSISHSLSGGSAKLVVTGFNLETKYLDVEIGSSGPTADFTASPVTGQAPLSVTFTDTSTGNLTSWNWDFGDGETSTLQNPSHAYTQEGSYSVALTVASDSDSDIKTMNNLISVTDDPNPDVYCEAMADNFNYEYIQEVKLGSFTNESQGSGYSDFTAQAISLVPGTPHTLTLTPGFGNSVYNEFWRTFIDFNQDNDFDDSGEMVFEGSGIDAVTGSITLPENTELGTTRMRVTMQFNDYTDPCGAFTYGEVEDYTVNITTGNDSPDEYCESKGDDQNYEYIKSVEVGSFSNSSDASPYSDFTSMTVNMNKGTAYPVILKPGFTGSSYSESWKIWIDLNQDGDFDDSDETIFQGASGSDVTGSITIPSSASSGNTRMRVSMGYNGYPETCQTISYGEVEDYTVTIQ